MAALVLYSLVEGRVWENDNAHNMEGGRWRLWRAVAPLCRVKNMGAELGLSACCRVHTTRCEATHYTANTTAITTLANESCSTHFFLQLDH